MRKNIRKAGLFLPVFFLLLCLTIPVQAKYASIWVGGVRMKPAVPILSLTLLEKSGSLSPDGFLEIRFEVSNREGEYVSDTPLRYWIELSVKGAEPSIALSRDGREIPLALTESGSRSAAAILSAGTEQKDEYLLQLTGTDGGELRLTVSAEQVFPEEVAA